MLNNTADIPISGKGMSVTIANTFKTCSVKIYTIFIQTHILYFKQKEPEVQHPVVVMVTVITVLHTMVLSCLKHVCLAHVIMR